MHKHTHTQTNKQTNKQASKQASKQAGKQKTKQTSKQLNKRQNTRTDKLTLTLTQTQTQAHPTHTHTQTHTRTHLSMLLCQVAKNGRSRGMLNKCDANKDHTPSAPQWQGSQDFQSRLHRPRHRPKGTSACCRESGTKPRILPGCLGGPCL